MPGWVDAILVFTGSILAALVTIFIAHAKHKRNEGAAEARAQEIHRQVQEDRRQTEAIHRRLDDHRREAEETRRNVAVLEARVKDLPNHEALRAQFEKFEEKIERRLQSLFDQLETMLNGR